MEQQGDSNVRWLALGTEDVGTESQSLAHQAVDLRSFQEISWDGTFTQKRVWPRTGPTGGDQQPVAYNGS